ncbi:hypothetical protein CPB84DRAFT_1848195 [Gymnopilus junonius]|uniref:Uncharacterized protein n=1 Tax=Gymnopilus junonius TaxID=109634 RepID=A0A9P5TMQ0_GYMJU|nr:hypothetical protein CPB84DRAFT_1848195 [Gymnopilus junonius]
MSSSQIQSATDRDTVSDFVNEHPAPRRANFLRASLPNWSIFSTLSSCTPLLSYFFLSLGPTHRPNPPDYQMSPIEDDNPYQRMEEEREWLADQENEWVCIQREWEDVQECKRRKWEDVQECKRWDWDLKLWMWEVWREERQEKQKQGGKSRLGHEGML